MIGQVRGPLVTRQSETSTVKKKAKEKKRMVKCTASKAPKKKYNSYVGLQNEEKEIAKAQLCIGKSLSILCESLRRQGFEDYAEIEYLGERLGMSKAAIETFMDVNNFYSYPRASGMMKFEYYFLYTVSVKVLSAFIPFLREYYMYPDSPIRNHICITEKTIEVYVPFMDGSSMWIHLAEMPYANVKSFDKLIGVKMRGQLNDQVFESSAISAAEEKAAIDALFEDWSVDFSFPGDCGFPVDSDAFENVI